MIHHHHPHHHLTNHHHHQNIMNNLTIDHHLHQNHSNELRLSPNELKSELENLRSIRRISLTQSSLDIDPDLPSPIQLDSNSSNSINLSKSKSNSNSFVSSPSSSSSKLINSDNQPCSNSNSSNLPSNSLNQNNLFWLPARLHPEIAPQEFKAFIEEATKPENLIRRTSSAFGHRQQSSKIEPNSHHHIDPNHQSLNRKKSMLSKIYDPDTLDQISKTEDPPPSPSNLNRRHSINSTSLTSKTLQGLENLTLDDLQKLEALAFKKLSSDQSNSSDPTINQSSFDLSGSQFKNLIRRSISMNGPSTLLTSPLPQESELDPIDDSPLIAHSPGQIIRRTARTKGRKSSLSSDGHSSRFHANRKLKAAANQTLTSSPNSIESPQLTINKKSSQPNLVTKRQESTLNSTNSNNLDTSPSNISNDPIFNSTQNLPSSLSNKTLDLEDQKTKKSIKKASLDSQLSNSSLLDAYIDQTTSSIDFPVNNDHLNLQLDHQSSSSTPHQPPSSPKPDNLKLQTTFSKPVNQSSEDLSLSSSHSLTSNSTITPIISTVKSTSSPVSATSSSPQTSTPSKSNRPPMTQTKTSPNLTTPSSAISLSTNNPLPSPSLQSSETIPKEKKRTWAKLGLSSSISTTDKAKKGKGKEKEKEKGLVNGKQKNESQTGQVSGQAQIPNSTGLSGSSVIPKKESGFLSGLFGGKSKKQDLDPEKQTAASASHSNTKQHPYQPIGTGLSNDLGGGNQQLINPTVSGGYIKGRFTSFYRLPIHVERAVYRLSHIKLANPRRPLYEQVLISNLMFWYLGVINKTQAGTVPNSQSNSNHHHIATNSKNNRPSKPQASPMKNRQKKPANQKKLESKTPNEKLKNNQNKKIKATDGKNLSSEDEDEDESESDSSSSLSSTEDDDDDEKPLGNRIISKPKPGKLDSKKAQASKSITAFNSSYSPKKNLGNKSISLHHNNKIGNLLNDNNEGNWMNGSSGSGGKS
ncbi:hypothetical protein O181_008858 [Austropuccinia psidii MF-1]|uniref:Protein Zds1 C-terminal domain-containing protein n=1 Tax=Austropuccinia psidii MF-1 TaxID=1389203 RepID=A0A9Q3BPY7_9BASI|nr:hypothetical protein [Austropuccinia psidii MF-1]